MASSGEKTVRLNNPILPGFHPDPSICVANGEYFIANSTFEWYPGVEITRSKDLVHWTTVPSPLNETRLLDMRGEKASCGIWAPCLSYSDGLFYLIYTNVRNWNIGTMKDCPNYLTTSPSIEGPWSDPVFMNASGFDASMFHDDDGRHWYINMEWDYRKEGPRQFNGIMIREYDPLKKCLVGERKKIFLGTDIGLVEGPHIIKKNGWYYILAAEGGTSYEHAITVGRSRKLEGPYEVHPDNPLITAYGHPELMLQRSGHGIWCDSPDGKHTYLAYLCGRPLPGTLGGAFTRGKCVLGRETGIAEIVWKDDWPYVTQGNGTLRNNPPPYVDVAVDADNDGIQTTPGSGPSAIRYDFSKGIHADFKTLRRPLTEKVASVKARPGFLRLYGGQSPWSTYEQSLLARRQEDFKFRAETKIEFEPDYFQQYAGMCYRYDEETQYLLQIGYDEQLGKIIQVNTILPDKFIQGMPMQIPAEKPVYLRLEGNYGVAEFSYSLDKKSWHRMRPLCDTSVLSDEYSSDGFTGAFVGMYCVDTEMYSKEADFEYFEYERLV